MVAHKATLVNALSRALAERVVLMDFTIGRKGFVAYLKSLGGSNIIKVVPSASVSVFFASRNSPLLQNIFPGASGEKLS